jgi:hypothetical protein
MLDLNCVASFTRLPPFEGAFSATHITVVVFILIELPDGRGAVPPEFDIELAA